MLKILIVEDEKAISNLIDVNLTALGYRCYCAYDGREAADMIEENTYDLVLLDIMLPEIDGYELLEYVKYQGTPVIVCRNYLRSRTTAARKLLLHINATAPYYRHSAA